MHIQVNHAGVKWVTLIILALGFTAEAYGQNQSVNALIDPVSLEFIGGNVVIEFDDLRQDTSNTSFEAQHSDDVTVWKGIAGSVVGPHATIADRYLLTAPEPGGLRTFYRVIGYSTTAEDADGDGLSDAFEETLGTLAGKVDSDDDGHTDGFEFFAGTDPNDGLEFPEDLRDLPEIEFEEGLSAVKEGDGTHEIQLKITPASYVGPIHYAVNSRSSAVSGIDFVSLSGTTTANGSSATIALDLVDNLTVNPERLLILDLVIGDPASGYRPSGAVTHVVCIGDNDAYWSGILKDTYRERDFRVCIAQSDGSVSVNFVSGNSDGLLNPDSGQSSQSTGLIPDRKLDGTPKEIWPEGGFAQFSPEHGIFYVFVFDIPLNTGDSPDPLVRSLSFTVSPAEEGTVQENLVAGFYSETIQHATDFTITHLNRNREGTFVLVRDVPDSTAIDSPLNPTD